MADKITRIAIVDSNRCKPKRCAQECKKVISIPIYGETMTDPFISVLSCGENGCEKSVE